MFMQGLPPRDLEGVEQETVEIRVRLGTAGFNRLSTKSVRCSEIWLTEQPDGTYALGLITPEPPSAQGFEARKPERDDREERFPNHRRGQ